MNVCSNQKTNKMLIVIPAMLIQILMSGFTVSAENTIPSKGITPVGSEMEFFNTDVITLQAGETKFANQLLNSIYEEGVSLTINPVAEQAVAPNTLRYGVGDYEVTFENFDPSRAGHQDIFMYVQSKSKSKISDNYKLNAVDTKDSKTPITGVISTYRLNVKVEDTTKPIIDLTESSVTLDYDEDFDAHDYVLRCYDEIDGDLDYSVTSDVDTKTAGDYTAKISASDKNGNTTERLIYVNVKEKAKVASNNYYNANANFGSVNTAGASASSVASAALSQLGQYQDCTSLVSRSLAAAGIHFGGYPAAYLSLGPIVSASQAQPGDVIYYANGGTGFAHVAIYVGNGQAVHGGWHGGCTVLTSAYVGSGPVFIHIGG
ncbi:MAG: NlpC/P60 family protein [Erysipelotrichaceae bacterium]